MFFCGSEGVSLEFREFDGKEKKNFDMLKR